MIFRMLWDFLMLYQVFLSPQVKWNAIISNKHGIHELPHELPHDFRLICPVVCYSTWKVGLASNTLRMIVDQATVEADRPKAPNPCGITGKAPLDIFCINETKLDQSFPNVQSLIEKYQFIASQKNRNSSGICNLVCINWG